jgi:hypothetical protein
MIFSITPQFKKKLRMDFSVVEQLRFLHIILLLSLEDYTPPFGSFGYWVRGVISSSSGGADTFASSVWLLSP